MTDFCDMNPFEDGFLEKELEFYGHPKEFKNENMELKYVQPHGRVNDYLNVQFRIKGPTVPILTGNVEYGVWMSLTWMEVQSAFLSICLAHGNAATAGLGLGYAALRMIDKVDHLDIYEKDANLVEWFKKEFGDRFQGKVDFIIGDVRDTLKGKEYDFVYVDIYDTVLPNKVIEDMAAFTYDNKIGRYRFWGQELAILQVIDDIGLEVPSFKEDLDLINLWNESNQLRMQEVDPLFAMEVAEFIEGNL